MFIKGSGKTKLSMVQANNSCLKKVKLMVPKTNKGPKRFSNMYRSQIIKRVSRKHEAWL